MKKNINPALIVVALVVIFAFYKSGFLGSFITTCNNIEPDNAAGFKELLANTLNLTTEQTTNQITINVENTTYNFNGISYTNGVYSINVYDTAPINCESVIDNLLNKQADYVKQTFQTELIRPDYNSTQTYYVKNEETYTPLTNTPTEGQTYYKQSGTSYVKMPTPYNTQPPILYSDPYEFYTPIGYKTISGKQINKTLYWCSNNQNTLLTTIIKPYETMNAYGPAVIQCKTDYINDTQVLMDECLIDDGSWLGEGRCACPGNQEYIKGTKCPTTTTTTTNSYAGTTTTTETATTNTQTTTQSSPWTNTNTLLGLGLIAIVFTYFVYNQFIKKKSGKKRKLF